MGKPRRPLKRRRAAPAAAEAARRPEFHLVIITGLSGSGKGSAIKVFEDSGYYSVDNLPVGLLARLVELVRQTGEIQRVAAVVDIREGRRLEDLPRQIADLRSDGVRVTLLFLEASEESILRRFSETRRPHPLAARRGSSAEPAANPRAGIQAERRALERIRSQADLVIDTSKFNVHELRSFIQQNVIQKGLAPTLQIVVTSFGFRNGPPTDADLVFDVRFLPNPNYIAALQPHSGRERKVAEYIRSFPQTAEFVRRTSDLLAFLVPHYIQEGKSYLNIAVGCTGGRHRSVYIAETLRRELRRLGYAAAVAHRDLR